MSTTSITCGEGYHRQRHQLQLVIIHRLGASSSASSISIEEMESAFRTDRTFRAYVGRAGLVNFTSEFAQDRYKRTVVNEWIVLCAHLLCVLYAQREGNTWDDHK